MVSLTIGRVAFVRVILSGANATVRRLRSRTRRKEGAAAERWQDLGHALRFPSEIPMLRIALRVQLRASPSAQDDTRGAETDGNSTL